MLSLREFDQPGGAQYQHVFRRTAERGATRPRDWLSLGDQSMREDSREERPCPDNRGIQAWPQGTSPRCLFYTDRPSPSGPGTLLVHRHLRRQPRPGVERGGAEGRGSRLRRFPNRPVGEAAVRRDRVVVPAPCLDQNLRFGQSVEDRAVKQLVAKRAVERLSVAVLPRAAGSYVQRVQPAPAEPVPHRLSDELRAIGLPNIR